MKVKWEHYCKSKVRLQCISDCWENDQSAAGRMDLDHYLDPALAFLFVFVFLFCFLFVQRYAFCWILKLSSYICTYLYLLLNFFSWHNGSRSLSWPYPRLFYLCLCFSFSFYLYLFIYLRSLVWTMGVDKIKLCWILKLSSFLCTYLHLYFLLYLRLYLSLSLYFFQINSCAFSSIERGWVGGSATLSTTTLLSLATLFWRYSKYCNFFLLSSYY